MGVFFTVCFSLLSFPQEECQNYVRVLIKKSRGDLLVCGTNAYKYVVNDVRNLSQYFNQCEMTLWFANLFLLCVFTVRCAGIISWIRWTAVMCRPGTRPESVLAHTIHGTIARRLMRMGSCTQRRCRTFPRSFPWSDGPHYARAPKKFVLNGIENF